MAPAAAATAAGTGTATGTTTATGTRPLPPLLRARAPGPQRGADEILDPGRRAHAGASIVHSLPRVRRGEAEIAQRRLSIGDEIVLGRARHRRRRRRRPVRPAVA